MKTEEQTQQTWSVVSASGALIACLLAKIALAPSTIPRYIPVVSGSGVLIVSALFVIVYTLLNRNGGFGLRLTALFFCLAVFSYLIIEIIFFFPAYYVPNRMLSSSYLCSILIAVGVISFSAFFLPLALSGGLFLLAVVYFILMNFLKLKNVELLLFPLLMLIAAFTFTVFNLVRVLAARLHTERKLSKDLSAARDKIINQEKLATLATFAAGTAHEINNPVTHMYGNIEYLQKHFDTLAEEIKNAGEYGRGRDDVDAAVEDIPAILGEYRKGFVRMIDIVNNMKRVFRQKSENTDRVDLAGVVYSSIDYFERKVCPDITFITSLKGPLYLNCNAGDFLSVFQILLSNSIEAVSDKDGIIRFDGSRREGSILFHIEDNGAGMDEEVRKNCFKPFFSTKASKTNMGIGLTLCRTILEQYGGSISIESTKGSFTRVTVTLPADEGG